MKDSIAKRFEHHKQRKEAKVLKDVMIPITTEARDLLQPFAERFDELNGQTLLYKAYVDPNIITYNAPDMNSVRIDEHLWMRHMGAALVAIGYDNSLEGIEEEEVINVRVAFRMIEAFTRYGIE